MSDPKRITHVLAFMDYNNLSEKEEELIVSFKKQFEKKKSLSDEQVRILEEIYERHMG